MATFLVEHYVPQAAADAVTARLAAACTGTAGVRLVRTIVLPGEETLLSFLTADSSDDVHRAVARAGLEPGHVQEALD